VDHIPAGKTRTSSIRPTIRLQSSPGNPWIYRISLIFGILVILFSQWYLHLYQRRFSFSSVPPQTEHLAQRDLPVAMTIPSLGLSLAIDPGSITNGIWQVSELNATFLEQSAALNEVGNMVIYGHNKRSILGTLPGLKVGSSIIITGRSGQRIEYEVEKRMIVSPTVVDVVYPTDSQRLTVYTCTGLLDSQRLVIQARPK
jgi:LPXTG-site transpeptidase (sortase) family protein